MKTQSLTVESIYHAFLALKEEEQKKFAEKISSLFRRKSFLNRKDRTRKNKWEELEKIIAPLRKGLPAGYKFDREDANAR